MFFVRPFPRLFLYPAKSPITRKSKLHAQTQLLLVRTHPERDLIYLNSLLASHLHNNDPLFTWSLFQYFFCTRIDFDSHTFTPVLGACSALPNFRRSFQVHALMIKYGCGLEIVPRTALVDMCSKYGLVDESVQVFDQMYSKDVVSWNALLSNFQRNGMPRKGLEVFQEMRKERVEFTEFTLCSLLKACSSLKAVRQGLQVHGLVLTLGRDLVILATALIDFYSDVGLIDIAIKVYVCLNCKNDDVLHNSFIATCVKNKNYKDAFLIMSTMRPNMVPLTSILVACSEKSDLWIGKQIHCVALRFCFVDDIQLSNALLDMYVKCGKINHAHAVFDGNSQKDVVSWTSMIDA